MNLQYLAKRDVPKIKKTQEMIKSVYIYIHIYIYIYIYIYIHIYIYINYIYLCI